MNSRAAPLSPGYVTALVGTLAASYVVSMFLRNSVGVIAPGLAAELGLSASQIGMLSGGFFLSFAAMQIPIGIVIDHYGPKRCMLGCVGIVVVATLLFAAAATSGGLAASRLLMGVGTSCYLMAPLALYARRFPPARFAALAGMQLGLGSIGAMLATAPYAYAVAIMGWRASFVMVAGIMAVVGVLIAIMVAGDDDQNSAPSSKSLRKIVGGAGEVLRTPWVGRLFIMHMATYSSFVLVVGLWGGPYLNHVYGYGLTELGGLLLIPAVTQVLGSFVWGASERWFASHKLPALLGGGSTIALLGVVAVAGVLPTAVLIAWLAIFGFCSAFAPVVIAHGKSLFPTQLVGRGIALLNMGTMSGSFASQLVTGQVIDLFPEDNGVYPLVAYRFVFLLQAAFVAIALSIYYGVPDPRREK